MRQQAVEICGGNRCFPLGLGLGALALNIASQQFFRLCCGFGKKTRPASPLLLVLLLALTLSAAQAVPPAPGTPISNVASSSQVEGMSSATSASNTVITTVGAASATATLAKAFAAAGIDSGTSTNLVFTISNSTGSPAQAGIAFVDTLPSGLQLTAGATATIGGSGCAGVASVTQPRTINVSGLSMTAGTSTCTVTVAAVSNTPNQFNADCSLTPPAFTNNAASVAGLANVSNSVTPQCLVVRGVTLNSVVPKCVLDAPYVDYNVAPVGVSAAGGVTVTWEKMDGTVVSTLAAQPLTGTLLWPGAAVNGMGQGVAWPGWQFVAGTWVPIADGLRPQMRLRFQINPTNDVVVSYPPATPMCNTNPPTVPVQPVLTKTFSTNTVLPTDAFELRFSIANITGSPAQSGISFVDTMPSGLRVLSSGNVSFSGCSGSGAIASGQISISGLSIGAGTSVCTVTVSGISAQPNVYNASCATTPPAFTNSSSNIGTAIGITNAVTPQCVVVTPPPPAPIFDPNHLPTLTKSLSQYEIVDGNSAILTFTLTPPVFPGNAPGGYGFSDILPDGLVLTQQAQVSMSGGGGCNATITFSSYRPPQQNIINVSDIAIPDPTKTCVIQISGITNVPGLINPDGCPGATAFTNDASRIDQLVKLNNGVTPQCMRVLTAKPTLTKSFADSRIYDGEVTELQLVIRNSGSRPAVRGVAFTDTLPGGLRLGAGATASLFGQGCTGTVTTAGNAIVVSALEMSAGTSECLIRVSRVTNAQGRLNPSCSPIAAAFTNGPGSISSISNLYNAVIDSCLVVDAFSPALDMEIRKSISASEGYSPSGPHTITITAANPATTPNARKRDIEITDRLPAGMILVPGSLRISIGGTAISASGAGGGVTVEGRTISYSASAGEVSASVPFLAPGESATLSFQVTIAPNLARDFILTNIAQLRFTNSADRPLSRTSEPVTFRVLGALGVRVTGQTIDSAKPGEELVFRNVVTNLGNVSDTYEISLSDSTFPAGSVVKLMDASGAALLPDTNGNGSPDTGVVPPGGSYVVVVRVQLPIGVSPGGPYSLLKTARSARASGIVASGPDIVLAIGLNCQIALDPDNTGRVQPGGRITYFHVLTNVGNCEEQIAGGVVTNSVGTWTVSAYLNVSSTPSGVVAGLPGSGNPPVSQAITLAPGQSASYLVDVTAPRAARTGDITTSTISLTATAVQPKRAASGNPKDALGATRVLSNRDTTTVDASGTNLPADVIRPFIDGAYRRPTLFGFIGQTLFIRADAPSCNAVPDVIERRTIIITGPNGEREEIVAIETGPNTGIFDASLPVRLPPVLAGDGMLEGNAYDTFLVEIMGCGRRIVTSVTLIDPNGVVFDSQTNVPVQGATVRIVTASGGTCSNQLAQVQMVGNGTLLPAPNPVVTRANGMFDFPLLSPGDYCVLVQPPNGYTWTSVVPFDQLPRGRNILVTGPTAGGSYGNSFRVGPETGPVILDIPVDPGRLDGLFIRKEVLRSVVELGEFADYTVTVNNQTGFDLTKSPIYLTDDLPAGFSYVAGSARVEGAAVADPDGKSGPRLRFNVGFMKVGTQVKLTYRVRVGPGALQGDGVNRVIANYRVSAQGQYSESNRASAKVTVTAGVFSDRAYVVGKVFADCNRDGRQSGGAQEKPEVGVPGVRLVLEDGTSAVTDAEGKYSFYGLMPRTHVLKVDRTTLPEGVEASGFVVVSNRQLGKGDSRILDLKSGDMHKANFAIGACDASTYTEIESRRRAASSQQAEIDGQLQQKLSTDPSSRAISDAKALPASGVLGQVLVPANSGATGTSATVTASASASATVASAGTTTLGSTNSFSTLATPMSAAPVMPKPTGAPVKPVAEETPIEELMPSMDNTLAFVGLKDGDVLPFAQSTIRVKGTAGATFRLFVNEEEVSSSRVGKKAVLDEKQLQAWEYIGVGMNVGVNELRLQQFDSFGNQRGEVRIKLKAPGELARIRIEFGPKVLANGGAVADGKSPVPVTVHLEDKLGTPVTTRLPVTLFATVGRWQVEDLNLSDPGVQVFIEGGKSQFMLLPPVDPAQGKISAESGKARIDAPLDFLPDLREMIAAGLIEGVLNLRRLDTRAFQPVREQDSFEREIKHLSRAWNGGKGDQAARAALFIKGKIRGDYLLTLAYDSDKDTKERLFRDIQPDEFYPVYGDSSVRAFDAQSTGRLYLRVDHKKSYLLYGDYNTAVGMDNRQLSNYNRSLTGVKQHFENSRVSVNAFASRDTTKQAIEEFPANGTSGPFQLASAKGLVNSEKIEVLTRDRNRSNLILRIQSLVRFVDYEIETLTGRILLKAPIASLDENLNPQSLRVTYEVDQGGPEFWVAGADVQFKVTDRIEVGAMVADDRNPVEKFRMMGINAVARIADKSFIIAEIAHTSREKFGTASSLGEVSGLAKRVEIKHNSSDVEGNLFVARSEAGFDNPNASISKGRTEAGGKLSYRIDQKTQLRGELLVTSDNQANSRREGILLGLERTLTQTLRAELAIRHARDNQATPVPGAASKDAQTEVTTVRARLTGDIPGVKGMSSYAEAEFDVQDTGRKILATGADYQLPNNGRLYARHEFASSITGPYGLNNQQRQNATVVGINTDYMKDGNVFSEYRIRDAVSGGDAEAALGLRNMWTLAEGVKLQTGFEKVHALSGTGNAESTALTFGLEYTANPLWKASSRLELRDGKTQDSILSTVALASKLSRNWTFLGRNTLSILKNKGQSIGENKQDRLQLGVAYRDTDADLWNALARVEHRAEEDTTQPNVTLKRTVEILSVHANWQPIKPFTFSGRYAAKRVNENSNGLSSRNSTQLLSGRAVWEIAPRWDASLNMSTMLGNGTAAKQYGLGLELGFMVMENLWLSAGYNWFGYRDADLTAGDYTNKGVYVRLRYKFDEDLFQSTKKSTQASAQSQPGADSKLPLVETRQSASAN